MHTNAKRGLCDGYCNRCNRSVDVIGVQYGYDHPEHYDGVSEWRCPRCGLREGRWTHLILTSNGKGDVSSEPRYGVERG